VLLTPVGCATYTYFVTAASRSIGFMAPLKTKVRKPIDTPIPKKEASSRRREVIAVAVVLLIAVVFKAVYLFQYKLGSPYYYVPIVDSQI
jgi:hypothetical protein